jgi:hypothetical protein
MANLIDVPCRVSADLRAKQLREDQYIPVEFDDSNEDHVRLVVPQELVKSVMGLLNSFHAIDRAERGFDGAIDHQQALKWLMPDLNRLREACARIFAEER